MIDPDDKNGFTIEKALRFLLKRFGPIDLQLKHTGIDNLSPQRMRRLSSVCLPPEKDSAGFNDEEMKALIRSLNRLSEFGPSKLF